MSSNYTTQTKTSQARVLRRSMTEAEQILWQALRAKQLEGHQFRRQHVLAGFIVDFVCLKQRLIIEVDGAVHAEDAQRQRDQERDQILRSHGFEVLRCTNEQVLSHLPELLTDIQQHLNRSR